MEAFQVEITETQILRRQVESLGNEQNGQTTPGALCHSASGRSCFIPLRNAS
ncbi:hypothetical protein HPP92_028956 [Vanilla planifolia]|uniref:Uncharacterized protein n=1 Tax=Vanilla planifolia TaxID=51239 RepID=A0A835U1Q5_VANPL|nr:hypothetical protein HPP92_028945 [Vanilla planifolia]KAG0446214.1 hypothetical protein HPP92_028956 [Vanilla planifolia]